MSTTSVASAAFLLLCSNVLCFNLFGQSKSSAKVRTLSDICFDDPQSSICKLNSGQYKLNGPLINPGGIYAPPKTAARPPAPAPRSQPLVREPRVALTDWRFAHMSPAMLMVINVRSLVQSPLLTGLFSALGGAAGAKSQEFENIRAALGDIGQILISAAASGSQNPSTMMLVRGNVDGPLGSLLRSSPGMQSQRLDAFSMLVGDPSSIGLANVRLKSTIPHTSGGLLRTATLEGMNYDIWLGIDPRYLGSAGFNMAGTSRQELDALSHLRGFSLGLYLRDQIRLEASVEAPAPEMAERMLAAYRNMEAKQKPGENPFGNQVWASTEGSKLRFIAIADLTKLKGASDFNKEAAEFIGPQLGPLMQAISALGSYKQTPAAAAQPKPQQGAIVITGLADGPKEIPVK